MVITVLTIKYSIRYSLFAFRFSRTLTSHLSLISEGNIVRQLIDIIFCKWKIFFQMNP